MGHKTEEMKRQLYTGYCDNLRNIHKNSIRTVISAAAPTADDKDTRICGTRTSAGSTIS
jgi:hypothetical protein